MKRWIPRAAILPGLVAAWFALRATVFTPRPVEVTVHRVARGRVESTVTNSRAGTVRARRRAQLSPETGGRVVSLPFREGDAVETGAVLVGLDDRSQRARLALARRALAAAEARYEESCILARRAEREFERNRRLAEQDVVSVDLLDRLQSAHEAAEAACRSAQARIEEAKAEVALAEAEVDKAALRAPFAGVLAEVAVELGEWVTPSPPGIPIPSILDLIDRSSIYVSAPMDEVDSAVIRAGQAARVTLDPFPARAFPSRVVRVAPYVLDVERQNRTVEIEVEIDDAAFAATLLPGTSADVEVVLDVREEVVRVPTSTLLEGGRVLLLEGDRLDERAVRPGVKNWDWTEVLGGLAEGEFVVTSLGREEVRAGARAVLSATDGDR